MSAEHHAEIEMTNPRAERVRDVARLATRPGRAKKAAFLAEGPQAVREALQRHDTMVAGGERGIVQEVFATAEALQRHPDLARPRTRVRLRTASPEVLAAMADTVSPQGIMAVCRIAETSLDEVFDAGTRLVAVLCRVQDPGNAGTILRAAVAAGADAVVLTGGSVDIYNPKAVRSTVGSIFQVPIVSGVSFTSLAAAAQEAQVQLLAADGYGDTDLDVLQDQSTMRRLGGPGSSGSVAGPQLEAPTAWLFGNEAQGLDEEELTTAGHRVAVPLYGVAESLNVGTAATVCLYASARAHRRSGPSA
ncbi:MAG: TrmH family RNA methyltransferase [Arthrobacter sp.]|uniref:TrmH family RNA methyltransferase n=1 Tax=unclassified Arthrobacter TaxID=235627 RepID=UPI002651EF05|nr:RNA methyltransferase [Micrococcaceae bacterium]MDN5811814.1 RNA methyltransferase [Micrococcaceae bacterium]MDN5822753.1 RNA methyltransferase [Micrococcaceae bacterium]MDN5878052.1 RNA methyltransferase [Micrococcaceae bacterium]MDN5885971.1 RNA methyltransferase [Micrococcaceae bacterium]